MSVSVRGLVKKFGDVDAVNGINLEVREGEFLVLLGPSGCGKTTTLRCIAGLERIDAGEIFLGDMLVSGKNIFVPAEKRKLGMVFQSYAIWPHMTVFGNVAYPLKIQKVPTSEIRERVAKVLNTVGLGGLQNKSATMLSGGQQQRVALARSIVSEPRMLLFDEPLSNLDSKLRERMRFELREMQKKLGITSVYVTHDQAEAMVVSDRIAVMNRGRIEQVGTAQELYEDPKNRFIADFIGSANLFEGRLTERTEEGESIFETSEGIDITCSVSSNLNQEKELAVVIRPEDIRILPNTPRDEPNLWHAKISRIVYLGKEVECHALINNREIRIRTDKTYNEGEIVLLHADPRLCKIVKR